MKNKVVNIPKRNEVNVFNDKITETLSKYTEKIVNEDKTVTYTEIPTTYFLENNKWNIDFFGSIEQFKKQVENYKYRNKNISFPFNNDNLNKEIKFIVYSKLFLAYICNHSIYFSICFLSNPFKSSQVGSNSHI